MNSIFIGFASLFLYAAIVFIVIYLYYEYYKSYWSKRNVPVLGFAKFYSASLNVLLTRKNIADTLKQLYDENKTRFLGFFVFNQPILIVNDPELIKQIIISDFSKFSDHTVPYRSPSDMIGTSTLFTTKNPTWKALRSKLSPFFTSGKLKQMFYLMNDVAAEFRGFLAELDEKPNHVETKEICAKYATDVISSCAFGVNSHCFTNENSEFRVCARRLFNWRSFVRRFSFNAYFLTPSLAQALRLHFWEPTSAIFLKNFFWQTVREREKTNFVRHDLVDMLIKMKNDEIFLKGKNIGKYERFLTEQNPHSNSTSDEQLVAAQAVQFFGAGFETVATTIALTIFEVARNTFIQDNLRSDVLNAFTAHKACSYEAICDMKYLDKCIKGN